jgi:RNA-directed DNA polymerase
MKVYRNLFEQIISPENLFSAWDAFKSDKRNKPDVAHFEWQLEKNIFELHRELKNKTYRHGSYSGFYITDPKQRHIHKAAVRDRVLHHAVFSIINPIFERTFIPRSFSCRIGYGTHKGVAAFERMARKISRNGTRRCFVLKCDVRKFFDTVDHKILLSILRGRIKDEDAMWLLNEIIESYSSSFSTIFDRKGVPIGNLTSQLFANVYMDGFDHFVKENLRVQHYARYTDDFVIISGDATYLENLLPRIREFLRQKLALDLHPGKIGIHKFHGGVDFLGYIVFPDYRLIRAKTKRRIFTKLRKRTSDYRAGKITQATLEQSLQSYLGVLSHANARKLTEKLKNEFWFQSGN